MYLLVFLRESLTFFLSLPPSENAKKNRRISSVATILELKMHARNMRTHVYARTNFQARFDRDTEDVCARVLTKLSYFFLFFCLYFFPREREECSLQKSARIYTMTERKSSRKTLTPKRFIPEETEKKDKDLSGGQKSGGSKVRLIS